MRIISPFLLCLMLLASSLFAQAAEVRKPSELTQRLRDAAIERAQKYAEIDHGEYYRSTAALLTTSDPLEDLRRDQENGISGFIGLDYGSGVRTTPGVQCQGEFNSYALFRHRHFLGDYIPSHPDYPLYIAAMREYASTYNISQVRTDRLAEPAKSLCNPTIIE